jgi:hypothetical protein
MGWTAPEQKMERCAKEEAVRMSLAAYLSMGVKDSVHIQAKSSTSQFIERVTAKFAREMSV